MTLLSTRAQTHIKEQFLQDNARLAAAGFEPEIDIEEPIAEGDRVVGAWTMRGTHQGDMMGLPPTGKKVAWSGITIYRIRGRKVIDERGEEDGLGLLRQLGAIPG